MYLMESKNRKYKFLYSELPIKDNANQVTINKDRGYYKTIKGSYFNAGWGEERYRILYFWCYELYIKNIGDNVKYIEILYG